MNKLENNYIYSRLKKIKYLGIYLKWMKMTSTRRITGHRRKRLKITEGGNFSHAQGLSEST
jgi:hypothetical protein